MAKRPVYTFIIPDDTLDGAAEGEREGGHEGDDAVMRQTTTMPHVTASPVIPLAAETGLIQVVSVVGEDAESDAAQDSLPFEGDTSAAQKVMQTESMADGDGEKLSGKILIVEDYPEVADVITVILRRMGFTTAHESHGVRAFERFNEIIPDMVLLDLALPDTTGWKVLDAIKDFQRASGKADMPITIVMTAYGDPANRLVGKLQGVHAYLIKPFTADELQRVVREAYKLIR
ncbi:MAG: response regulator [bacterium]|nr:response regulator [bacterium]